MTPLHAHVQQALARNDVVSSISCCDVASSIVFLCIVKEGYCRLFFKTSSVIYFVPHSISLMSFSSTSSRT